MMYKCFKAVFLLVGLFSAVVAVNADTINNDPNLIGMWTFNDGTAADWSQYGHDGEICNDSLVVFDAERGMVLQNHTGGHVDCGGEKIDGDPITWADVTGNYSVACWIKTSAFEKDWQPIVTKGTKASGQMILTSVGNQGRIYFRARGLESENDHIYGSTFVDDGVWHHIAAVCERLGGGQFRLHLYIDGQEEPVSPVTATSGALTVNNAPIYIGGSFYNYPVAGDLLIDDVRIFNKALESSEINTIMNDTIPADLTGDSIYDVEDLAVIASSWLESDQVINAQTDLVARWTFEGPAGSTTVEDLVGDNDATIIGGATLDGTGSVDLAGGTSGQYVDLGVGFGEIIQDMESSTFIIDFTWDGNANGTWQKLLTFKQEGTSQYTMLTFVSSNEEYMRWQHRYDAHDEQTNVSTPNLLGRHQIAVVINRSYAEYGYAQIFVDGQEAGFHTLECENTMSLMGNTPYNWIGRSPYDGANFFDGKIHELRIYNRSMISQEIADIYSDTAYEIYKPLEAPGNFYNAEPEGSKVIDFKDISEFGKIWLTSVPEL